MGLLLDHHELKQCLIERGSRMHFSQGDFLFQRGDEVRGLFLILSGQVRLGLDGESSALPSRDLGPGAILGLPATLSDSPYSLTAQANAKTEVIYLARAAMLDILRTHSKLCLEVMNLLSEELAETRNALARIHRIRA
ncbi:MAG TPA: cyclic nucleotide-binding domain-containing protein [Terriglobales bacterium]|nr:cyclic nucleotide-binding domain-containing protein [Terriglobales bacterium]